MIDTNSMLGKETSTILFLVVVVVLISKAIPKSIISRMVSRLINFTPNDTLINGVYYPVSYWSEKGYRPYQEDRHHQMKGNGEHDSSLYAVYDGHGGPRASDYCKEHMIKQILAHHSFTKDPAVAMKDTFLRINKEFSDIARSNSYHDGTTAIVAAIHDRRIVVANVGDSRGIVVCKGGKFKPMSFDHKPNREDEMRRIRKLGGDISYHGRWRVQGVLAVSRAIGDVTLQPFVSGDPDILDTLISDEDHYLVLASDGLWDVFSNEQVAQLVHSFDHGKKPFEDISKELCYEALVKGSVDNITVVVVDLRLKHKPTRGAIRDVAREKTH